MNSLPVIDWVFIALIVLMLVHGYVKGFIEEIFSWATIVLALWMGVIFYQAGGAFLRTKILANVRVVPEVLAFVAIFIIVTFVLKTLERILKDVIQGAKLGSANKVIGAVFGVVEGLAITTLILFVLRVQPLFDASNLIGESVLAEFLLPFTTFI
ncbi:MAG: CvpA family protein [Treponema sp.]|jgi:membrane protein required for colicin V production|nr:CvpA family protein [Treponema sp.]